MTERFNESKIKQKKGLMKDMFNERKGLIKERFNGSNDLIKERFDERKL